jgi:tape measure domain-containing protein
MTFVVGELAARIRLDGQREFESGIQSSGKAFTKLQDLAKKAGGVVESGMKAAGTAVDFLSVSTVALGTKVFSAGAAYNTLQQTSRAALKTLLGGAEAANAQMDKLDAFAKNSPFSKAVFIQAQQQLIGFGFAADKVLPTLDAIQQAVAATGGSSASIGEIASILAKVSASAKFTAEDLNMLGERGIDAATLIGGQMGLTGQEIREQITAGTLDAGAAIDALTAGMAAKFAGASANVKGTMDGASDRVKAATRDIGAALAEPFVSKNGGGRAVDWANQVADLLRAVEKQTTPFTNWIVSKLNPAFAGVTDTLFKAKVTVESWNVNNLDRSLAHLTGYAPALAGLAGVLASYGPIAGLLARVGVSINPVLAGIVGLVAASPELRDSLGDLLDEMSPLVPLGISLAKVLASSLGAALPIVSDGVEVLADVAGPLIDLLADIPAPVLLGVAALLALQLGMRAATAAGTPLGGMIASTSTAMTVHARAATAAGVQTGVFGTAAAVARTQVMSLGGAMKAAFLTNPIGLAITVISLAAAGLVAAFASTSQQAAEQRDRMLALRDSLNQTTGAMTEATRTSLENAFTNSDAYSKAQQLGLGVRDLTDAALGQKAAVDKVTKAVLDWNEAHTVQTGDGPVITDNAASVTEAVKEQAAALEEAEKYVREKAQADREAISAMGEGERANYRFKEAMKVVSDETKSAEDRVNALRTALDLLKGGSLTAEQAQAQLSRTVLDLKDVLAQADEAGAPLWQSFLDGAGNVNLSTRAGLAFSDQMSNARTKMLQAATAAADLALANGDEAGARDAATAAAQGYIDSLRQTLTEAGLTSDQIEALIGKYLDVPETVGTVITDNVPDVEARVADLAAQILATPDKTVTITEPMSDLVKKRLTDLGVVVTTLPDGNVQITSSGGPEVEAELQRLTVARKVIVSIQQVADAAANIFNADGGVYRNGTKAYANGGIPGAFESAATQAFANGGYPSGIYKGRPGGIRDRDRIFAEQETRREAYISDKVGQEARNLGILKTVAPWFNATVLGDSEISALRASNGSSSSTVNHIDAKAYASAGMDEELLSDLIVKKIARQLK